MWRNIAVRKFKEQSIEANNNKAKLSLSFSLCNPLQFNSLT